MDQSRRIAERVRKDDNQNDPGIGHMNFIHQQAAWQSRHSGRYVFQHTSNNQYSTQNFDSLR
jgi:hypothetical protein